MAEENKIYITEEGLQKLKEEYEYKVHVEREEVKSELAEARSLGDLSENADYDAARERQAQVEARITELEYQLNLYIIIDATKSSKKIVHIGSTVTLKFLDTEEEESYNIVGSTEADPLNGKLSNETPLAMAILDRKVGQIVDVQAKIPYQVQILSIN
ncbi:MAG: transcription elongation factor GreA [Solobacterium sp.]|nr:transcription elongation factor GreA [Solobacterium sp.]